MAVCILLPLGPACLDLDGIRAGDRNEFILTLKQDGDPVDLTGLIVTASARYTVLSEAPVLNATVTITDAAAGKVSVRWPGSLVRVWIDGAKNRKGVWDLQVVPVVGSTDPDTLLEGKFIAYMDVTR